LQRGGELPINHADLFVEFLGAIYGDQAQVATAQLGGSLSNNELEILVHLKINTANNTAIDATGAMIIRKSVASWRRRILFAPGVYLVKT
jgi:hypothetical protein